MWISCCARRERNNGNLNCLPDAIDKTGSDQPHNTMPPFVALYYCIKE